MSIGALDPQRCRCRLFALLCLGTERAVTCPYAWPQRAPNSYPTLCELECAPSNRQWKDLPCYAWCMLAAPYSRASVLQALRARNGCIRAGIFSDATPMSMRHLLIEESSPARLLELELDGLDKGL